MNTSRPSWVDFHCHLDLYPDTEQIIARCDADRVATLAVTTTPKAWLRNRAMASRSTHVRVALGLHPQLVAERADDFSEFERFLPDARYVGEIGLDAGPRHYKSLETQKQIFDRALKLCAMQGNKILTIHSVRAVPTVLDMLEDSLPPGRGKAVLHWFTGTPKQAARAAELGCYFSINAEMLDKPQHHTLIAGLPEDRLLTETDGPFVNVDDRPTIPSDVVMTVTRVAEVRGCDPQTMSALILSNLRELVAED